MHLSNPAIPAACLAIAVLATVSNAQAFDCFVSGTPSAFGANMTGTLPIGSGQSCTHGFRFDGVLRSSKIIKRPQHGTVKLLNISTIEYAAKAGYRGQDSFAIQATGSGPRGSGTSIVTMNVIVQ